MQEVYLVANVDVRNDKLKKQFLEAVAAKHPDVRIVYISKTGKPDLQVGNGIDAVLERPKAEVVATKKLYLQMSLVNILIQAN